MAHDGFDPPRNPVGLGWFRLWGRSRISVGGALARVIWAALLSAAQQLKAGSFDGLAGAIPGQHLNEIFGSFV